MLDVHVLTHSGTRAEWLQECLLSLQGQPCTVHVLQGDEGNIAAGRERGFALGTHPYLTFVDSDDYVLPGAMAAMLGAMHSGAATAVSREHILEGTEIRGQISGHHLFAIRRDVLAPHLEGWGIRNARTHCIPALARLAKPVLVDAVTYVWRLHKQQTHKKGQSWSQ